jgi:hypothetical protein
MSDEEQLLVRFFLPTKRERYAEMISNPKKRRNFVRELAHFNALDPRYLISILPNQQHPEKIDAILTQKGAPQSCWVVSENRDIDGKHMPLLEALKEVVGREMGTIISSVPGKLAFFEGEQRVRWILERPD